MTTAKEIITSLSVDFKKACDEYIRMYKSHASKKALDMQDNLCREAKNALMYYVADYYHDSEKGFSSDVFGSWYYKRDIEILAIGNSDCVSFYD